MEAKELRIGNYVNVIYNDLLGEVFNITRTTVRVFVDNELEDLKPSLEEIEPIQLTEEWLIRLGFYKKTKEAYINGFQYLLQVDGNHDDIEIEGVDRDGTWFDGIGTMKEGELVVNTLCKGNYVCNAVRHVHQLQNLYYALTNTELTLKD